MTPPPPRTPVRTEPVSPTPVALGPATPVHVPRRRNIALVAIPMFLAAPIAAGAAMAMARRRRGGRPT
ncbi:MAG TPA: hypothetical protein VIS06_04480 [Mycobacteriales bacterium]